METTIQNSTSYILLSCTVKYKWHFRKLIKYLKRFDWRKQISIAHIREKAYLHFRQLFSYSSLYDISDHNCQSTASRAAGNDTIYFIRVAASGKSWLHFIRNSIQGPGKCVFRNKPTDLPDRVVPDGNRSILRRSPLPIS